MSKDIKTHNWGTNPIQIEGPNGASELRPTEIHLKEDGALDGGPTITIVMSIPNYPSSPKILGQLSIKMWNEALNELDYQITKV